MSRVELKEPDYEAVEYLASKLFTYEQIGDYLGIHANTFRNILKRDESLLVAYKRGRMAFYLKAVSKLEELIESGNPASVFFVLKTKFGFRETDQPTDDVNKLAQAITESVRAMNNTYEEKPDE